jgi:hypothetical protein
MLELASQGGFRGCAQRHVFAPGIPGNVERAGFVDSLVRNAGLYERPKLAPEAGSVPASVESREIVRDGGLVAPHNDPCRHRGRPSVFWGTHNSLRQNRLSAITPLGEEPLFFPGNPLLPGHSKDAHSTHSEGHSHVFSGSHDLWLLQRNGQYRFDHSFQTSPSGPLDWKGCLMGP